MKHVVTACLQGWRLSIGHGWTKPLGLAVVCGALAIGSSAIAGPSTPVTQLEFVQWLVQSCGDSSQFTATSTAGDYIEWAAQKGINGLQADAKLTRGVLAQSLVKLFGIKGNKQGGDPVLILKREGIDLPTEMEITRAGLVNTFDDIGFKTRAQLLAAADMSPSKGGNGIGSGGGTPPPGDPPPNPNYGTTPPGKDPTGTLPHPGRRVGQTR